MSSSTIYLGLDVHQESITVAVLPEEASAPTRVERLSSDLAKLWRFCERLVAGGDRIRACDEASGAGSVVHRALTRWGHHCDVIAPSLIPTRPGGQRKHDTHDAVQLARLYRAGELTTVRIPTEAEERVRDVVRCRETFQREVLKSRHDILKFLARRGFVYRDGTNWSQAQYEWLRRLAAAASPLARREALGAEIAALALTPALAGTVQRLQCFRGIERHAAMVPCHGDRRLAPVRPPAKAHGVSRAGAQGTLFRRPRAPRVAYQGGQHALPARARAGGVGVPRSTQGRHRAHASTARPGLAGDRARVEGAASAPHILSAPRLPYAAEDRRGRRGARARRVPVECDAGRSA